MTESDEDKIDRLRSMIVLKQKKWDLSFNDVNAITFALAEIERLTTENTDLKSKLERESTEELTKKLAELAILFVNSQCEILRLKRRVNKALDARLNGSVVFIPPEGESHGKLN